MTLFNGLCFFCFKLKTVNYWFLKHTFFEYIVYLINLIINLRWVKKNNKILEILVVMVVIVFKLKFKLLKVYFRNWKVMGSEWYRYLTFMDNVKSLKSIILCKMCWIEYNFFKTVIGLQVRSVMMWIMLIPSTKDNRYITVYSIDTTLPNISYSLQEWYY